MTDIKREDDPRFFYVDEVFDIKPFVVYYSNIPSPLILKIVKGLKAEAEYRKLLVPEFAVPPTPAPQVKIMTALTVCEKALIESGRKIIAIKEVRQRLNLGLKDAKDAVDAYFNAWREAGSPAGGVGPDADGGW